MREGLRRTEPLFRYVVRYMVTTDSKLANPSPSGVSPKQFWAATFVLTARWGRHYDLIHASMGPAG